MEIEADANKSVHSLDSIEFFSRYRTIIRLLRSGSMENVYKVFEHTYAIHQVVNAREGGNKKLLTVALGMDLNSGWKGSIPKSWEEQNAELATLSKNYPVIPYFPIDPRRENLYEEFLKAFDQSNPQFFGIKCYPSLGYLPADKQLMPIFKICEEKNIPVMAHCGGESVSTFDNPIKVNRLGTTIYINDPTRALRARKLNEPSEWEYVLKEFNDLRLCLGHFGGVKAWENHQDTAHRIPKILEMMDTYKNLYADFSYNLESLPAIQNFRDRLFNSADSTLMKERTFFGTDFWVILPFSNLIKDQHNFVEETQSVSDELLKTNVLKYMKLL